MSKIEGLYTREAVTPGTALQFIMSDGSIDRHGTRLNPDGWNLSNFIRNPVAFFNHDTDFPIGQWENVRHDKGRLVGTLKLAKRGISARIDEIVGLVELGILRAASVGFKVLKDALPGKDFDYDEMELIECSLVSVGSNTNALAQVRSMGVSAETQALVFGEQATATHSAGQTEVGEQAPHARLSASRPISGIRIMEKSVATRIVEAEARLNNLRDDLDAALAANSDTDELSGQIEDLVTNIGSMKRAEKALGKQAMEGEIIAPAKSGEVAKPAIRRPLGARKIEPKPGELIFRAAACIAQAHLTDKDPIKVMEMRYGDNDATQTYVRAAIDPGKTTVTGWAAELIELEQIAFLESLKPMSVYPTLASAGLPLSFGPGRGQIKIPSRATTPSISGSFVLEGAPIPVRRMGLTSITLTPQKLGVISYFTRELARLSNPQIESVIREGMQDDTAITLDTLLLDATAGSATRPAGLTNGVTASASSSAGGFSAIIEDITTLATPFDTANAGRKLVMIMNPREARYIAMTPGPNGVFGWASNILSEFQIIRSTNVTAGSVYMIDAADFVSVSSAPDFEASEQAVIHAEDTTPLQIGTVGSPNTVAAPVYSMFQTDSIAIRMLMDLTWAMRRAGMVKFITAADWAPVA